MNLRPTHRNPEAMAGLEVCDLCGLMVEQHRLIEADVEGLRGLVVCDAHPWERRARDAPSLNDIRAMTPPPYAPEAGQRLEPIGGDPESFADPGIVLREDGAALLREGISWATLNREAA